MADTQGPAGLPLLRTICTRRTGGDLGLELCQSVVWTEESESCKRVSRNIRGSLVTEVGGFPSEQRGHGRHCHGQTQCSSRSVSQLDPGDGLLG